MWVLPVAEKSNRWNRVRDLLRLVQEAFRYQARTFQLELVETWRSVNHYIEVAVGLRALPSVLRQDARLSRILFSLGRTGLLAGIGLGLQGQYAPLEDQLPERLASMLKQL